MLAPFAPEYIPNLLILYAYDRGVFQPMSWSPVEDKIAGIVSSVNSTTVEVQILNIGDLSLSLIRRDVIGNSLSENPQLEFLQTRLVAWNPIYEEWFAFQLDTFVEGTEDNPERPSVSVVIVQNHLTGETHILNDLIGDEIFRLTSDAWSPDGHQLVLETKKLGTTAQIITVLDTNGQWQFQSGISAPDMNDGDYQQVVEWLGEGNLLLLTERDDSTVEQIYFIGQIIAGEMHLIEFFRIPITSFSDARRPRIGQGDFYLTADEAERHTLSCLFDQAQPTRLSIGEPARVNFTTSTPLRLRAEPDLNLDPIQQMPEGTGFDVISGPACINAATDYYRFWQIQLSDGTVGWAAEAGMTDYFMEPLNP
jgi:hypothetical protein